MKILLNIILNVKNILLSLQYMILKTQRIMLFLMSTLYFSLFLSPFVFANQEIIVYEELDMTYCSWYARTKLTELTQLPQTNDIRDIQNAIVQGDAITLIDQGLAHEMFTSLDFLPGNPEAYTLLDFYVYTPSNDEVIDTSSYFMQGHRAVLLYIHDTRWIYDPVKIAAPYRQNFETYRVHNISPSAYAYFLKTQYTVKEFKKATVDELFVIAKEEYTEEHAVATILESRSQELVHPFIQPVNLQQTYPTHYRVTKTLVFQSFSGVPVYLLSGTQFTSSDLLPFSFDLVEYDEHLGFSLPGRQLTINHPMIEIFSRRLPVIPSINKI